MRTLTHAVLLALTATVTACNPSSPAYGDFTSIIAVMSPSVWEEVHDTVEQALEPTIRTVSDERTFTVTYQDPNGEEWHNLRRFRQLLLVGTGDEPWMQEALAQVHDAVSGPGLHHAGDVWARGQQATIILAAPGGEAAAVRSHLVDINRSLDAQFRTYVRNRMYTSGADSALTDTVARMAGFTLALPKVYTWRHQDSIYTFRNDNPDPSELIREITVTWRSPAPAGIAYQDVLDWRARVAATYSEPQNVDVSRVDTTRFEDRGLETYQVQALWTNPPELDWPAAGPFITRALACPQQNRLYLLDAWLYAPGKDKYEYMIQLQTILDSFRCGSG